MLSWYKVDNLFYVTWQNSEYSEIELIYCGVSELEQMKIVDNFISEWG